MSIYYDTATQTRLSPAQLMARGVDPASDLSALGLYPVTTDLPTAYDPVLHMAVDTGIDGSPEAGYHIAWRLDSRPYPPDAYAAKLVELKTAKLAQIQTGCAQALAALSVAYPDREVQTWPQQVAEATALATDPNAAAPLLRKAAATRQSLGDTPEARVAELAKRVLAKASAWSDTAGEIIGTRQTLEEALDTAATLDAVTAISTVYPAAE